LALPVIEVRRRVEHLNRAMECRLDSVSGVQTLGNIMTTQVPVAPLLYGADWNVYSTARFTGWVTASKPYMNPSPNDPGLPYILMKLKRA